MKRIICLSILLSIITLNACSAQKDKKSKKKTKAMTEAASEVTKEKMTEVLIETSMGNIQIALYNETPQHRDNFIKLVCG